MKNAMMAVLVICVSLLFSSCVREGGEQPMNFANEAVTSESPVLPENPVYVNEQCGYQLDFPDSWKGYYYIKDENPNAIEVYFYGKSNTGSILLTEEYGVYGLPMFMILAESEFSDETTLDSVRQIGNINGVDYYYATSTSAVLPMLLSPEEYGEMFANGRYVVDDTEIAFAKQDWEKVETMQMDVDEILETFRSVEAE